MEQYIIRNNHTYESYIGLSLEHHFDIKNIYPQNIVDTADETFRLFMGFFLMNCYLKNSIKCIL